MNDCPNAEFRDRLPDLLHERLDVSLRAAVVAHVAGCVDCREELALLRGAHSVLVTSAPRIDVTQIVAALPKAGAAAPRPARRAVHMNWRIAAAATFLAVGGSSIALLNRAPAENSGVAVTVPATSSVASRTASASASAGAAPTSSSAATAGTAATPNVAAVPSRVVASSEAADAQAADDVAPGGRFSNLSAAQLKALLDDIGQLPAVPVTEPDPVAIRVNSGASATPEGL